VSAALDRSTHTHKRALTISFSSQLRAGKTKSHSLFWGDVPYLGGAAGVGKRWLPSWVHEWPDEEGGSGSRTAPPACVVRRRTTTNTASASKRVRNIPRFQQAITRFRSEQFSMGPRFA